MAYIGRDIDNGLLTKQTFTGVNGSTTVFTLDQSVGDATSLIVSVGGAIQEPNVGFTAAGNTLTFTGAPANGATVWAIYIGKEVLGEGAFNTGTVIYQTGTGDTTTTPITLSQSVGGTSEILVALNGVVQVPDTEYTVSGTTLTFASAPANGVGILVYYFGTAGLLNVVADGAVTAAGFAASGTLPAWNGNALTNLDAADLTGPLPAINASNLTGLVEGLDTTSANDPTITTNPGTGVGTMWLNSSSGELYCCTDATTNDNVWTNIGGGAGHIMAPTNANDTFPDLQENATTNFTFAGGTDDGTVTHYYVDQISNTSLLGVTASEVAAGSAHSFVTQAVGSNTSVTFRVRTKDNSGLYSPGITITTIILNNVAPTNPNNTASFADMYLSASYNFTFSGATDPDAGDSVTHYMVDQISNAALTVTAAEVAAGQPHAFSSGAVGSDTAITFRVRAKDTVGNYSSGATVSMTILAIAYTTATGGSITTSGDYKFHTFTGNSTFTVSSIGTPGNDVIDLLVVAGGGGGGYGSTSIAMGGGGAGGYQQFNNMSITTGSYGLTVGGGAGSHTQGNNSSINIGGSNRVSYGGGFGGYPHSGNSHSYLGSNGGSGGGSGYGSTTGGSAPYGQGNNGGGGHYAGDSNYAGGGGGGKGSAGTPSSSSQGGNGGAAGSGQQWSYNGTYYSGGGGGGSGHRYSMRQGAPGGSGGGGAGGGNNTGNNQGSGVNGTANTGGGGGGQGGAAWTAGQPGGGGGSGIIIMRYKYQN